MIHNRESVYVIDKQQTDPVIVVDIRVWGAAVDGAHAWDARVDVHIDSAVHTLNDYRGIRDNETQEAEWYNSIVKLPHTKQAYTSITDVNDSY